MKHKWDKIKTTIGASKPENDPEAKGATCATKDWFYDEYLKLAKN